MSTHTIGFYEDLTKLSLNYHQISSNTLFLLFDSPWYFVIYLFYRNDSLTSIGFHHADLKTNLMF